MTRRRLTALLAFAASVVAFLPQAHAQECFPQCRTGYVCARGQCISECNPPCEGGLVCVHADCVAPATASAPAAAPAPAPAAVPAPASGPAPAPSAYPTPAPAPAGSPQPAYAPAPVAGSPQPAYSSQGPAPMPVGSVQTPDAAGPAPAAPGVHVHDGFYFRFGIGAGGGSIAGTFASPDPSLDGAGVDAKGFTIPVELSFGGTVARGLVIGGGSFGAAIVSPDGAAKNYGVKYTGHPGPIVISSVGPFVDYYLNPEKGLHLQAAVGFASVTVSKNDSSTPPIPDKDYSGTGWALMAGVGYETWVGEQWSMGVLGRVQYGHASLDRDGGNGSYDANFLIPALLGTLTYH